MCEKIEPMAFNHEFEFYEGWLFTRMRGEVATNQPENPCRNFFLHDVATYTVDFCIAAKFALHVVS